MISSTKGKTLCLISIKVSCHNLKTTKKIKMVRIIENQKKI